MRASLARPSSRTVPVASPVSAAKPTITAPARGRVVLSSWRMSGFWVSSRRRRRAVVGLLDLGLADRRRPEVRGRGGHDDGVGRAGGRQHLGAQLLGGLDADHLDAGGVRQRGVRGDQGDLGAARRRRPGPARSPAAPRSGCRGSGPGRGTPGCRRPTPPPGGRPGRSAADAAREHVDAHVVDLVRLGQPALAGVGTGQPALGGLDDQAAALAQGRDVRLGGGVLPHLGVHRGREHDRAPGGEQGVGEQVVGQAVRGLGQQVGGRRRDHDQVGRLADPDVRDLVDVLPHLGGDRLAGQRRPGRGAHEVQRRSGGYDGDVVAGLGEPAQQLRGLVGRDASGDPEDDRCSGE